MTRENAESKIRELIENMDDGDAVSAWNEFCNAAKHYDDRVENMAEIPDLFDTSDGDAVFNLLNRFYFGHDSMNGEQSSADPNRNWFWFNGYGNIVSSDYPWDQIDAAEMAAYAVENDDDFYNDEIREILDEIGDDENDD